MRQGGLSILKSLFYLSKLKGKIGTVEIREKLHDLIDKADDRLLNLIFAMMVADTKDYQITETQKNILDQRLASHNANSLTGSSWEEAKIRVKQKL